MITNIKEIIIAGIVIWVVVFGVNVDGKHYGLNFSTNGVSVVWGR